jgi:hypothetical protein
MSYPTSGYTPAMPAGVPVDEPITQVARDESTEVGRTAADAAGQVAGTATDQARNVAQEAKAQARDLMGEVRGEVQQQARNGQDKATDGLRALAQELREMVEGGQKSGPASEVARQVADRADRAVAWLGEREPGDLIDEVRSFARRRPAAFLIGAGVAGVIVGRLTRGAVDTARSTPAVTGPPGHAPYNGMVDAPPMPSAPRPDVPPVDAYAAGQWTDPLYTGSPLPPAVPVTGYPDPAYGGEYTGDLEDEASRRRDALPAELYPSENGDPR